MVKIQFLISTILLTGCAQIGQLTQPEDASEIATEGCPDTPLVELPEDKVTTIALGEEKMTESGIVDRTKSVGFAFEAESGQKLNYQTDADICVWIYTPDMQLLNSGVLPKTGRYILQVGAPKGSTTFDIAMSLESEETAIAAPSTTVVNTPVPQPSPRNTTVSRPDPAGFVRSYYSNINNGNYTQTWPKISPAYQQSAGGYSSYVDWWNSVRQVQVGAVQTLEQTADMAIVDADLQYTMNTGRVVPDSKRRIRLVWDNSRNSWLFENKWEP